MASIHNYGVRQRYRAPDRDAGAGSGRGAEHSDGLDHWSSDGSDEEDRPLREPVGPDEADGGRRKIFPGAPGRRKLE
jgi:hypothetical protein